MSTGDIITHAIMQIETMAADTNGRRQGEHQIKEAVERKENINRSRGITIHPTKLILLQEATVLRIGLILHQEAIVLRQDHIRHRQEVQAIQEVRAVQEIQAEGDKIK
jgi:hypothetical protein